MRTRITVGITASLLAIAASAHLIAQTRATGGRSRQGTWLERTPWGDPDLRGEWTSEGEFGVPFERPPQFGLRQFLTDDEYAKRLEEVRLRDERDLAPVDVLSGKVDAPTAPIPHWREYNTTSRRTSLVIDPPDGRFPPRTAQARPFPVPQRCGSLLGGEPCDSYEEYGLGVRCIVHGGGFPDAMVPAVYNANMRIVQSPGFVAIIYELIHDTRVIPLDPSPSQGARLSPAIRTYMGAARGRWDGTTLVVESSNLKANTRGSSPGLRLIERFTRTGRDATKYEVTFVDPATWTAPWTAALDLKARPDGSGVFEYACHEGNYGMSNMLAAARFREGVAGEGRSKALPLDNLGIEHLDVVVPDPAASARFYARIFRSALHQQPVRDTLRYFVLLGDLPADRQVGYIAIGAGGGRPPAIGHYCVLANVYDRAGVASTLQAAGFGVAAAGPTGMWPDPDRLDLQLFQPPAGLVTAAVPSPLPVARDGLLAPHGVDHVLLRVSSLERSLPYYRLVYGAAAERARDSNGRVWFHLERDTRLGLEEVSPGQPPTIAHYAIKVAPFDRAALETRLRALGTSVLPAEDEPDVVRFADNYGVIVEVRVAQ